MRTQRLESLALLAAGLSHDLRNVLQPLLIVSELMEGYSDDPRMRRLAALVSESGRRGHEMAESMLSFARGSRAASETVPVQVLFDSVRLLLQGSLPRAARMELVVAEPDLCVEGNRTELQQCLINLGLNGLQAMAAGGGTLRIDAHATRDADGAAWTCLRVSDDGPGIGGEALGRLFTPFYTTKETGTGLGLLSCKRIVVDSVVGQGYDVAVARVSHATCARIARAPMPALVLLDGATWQANSEMIGDALSAHASAARIVLLAGAEAPSPEDQSIAAVLQPPHQVGDVFGTLESVLGTHVALSATAS